MDDKYLHWIKSLIANRNTRAFYRKRKWKRVRKEMLADDKDECQWCKAKGFYSAATVVHHIYELDKYPEWALSKTVIKDGKEERNLVSICRECHEKHHQHGKKGGEPLTVERW